MASLLSFLSLLLFAHSEAAAKTIFEKHCDYPLHTSKSFPSPTPESCQHKCRESASCQAFVFISHWNRCVFKAKVGKKFTVRMLAAKIDQNQAGDRRVGEVHQAADSTGKDIKLHQGIKSMEACQQLCFQNKDCGSLIYIPRYQTCAPKKRGGKIVEKIFYCGVKPA